VYIVYFHNVLDRPLDLLDRRLSRLRVDTFARQIETLCSRLRPRPLAALVAELRAGHDDPEAFAITFDDAYRGVLDHALPVLEAAGATATVFAVTATLARGWRGLLHFDELELAFRHTRRRWLYMPSFSTLPQPMFTPLGRVLVLKRLKRWLKLLPEAARRRAHQDLLCRLEIDPEALARQARDDATYSVLEAAGLERLYQAGWSIGAHSHRHHTLSRLDDAELHREVAGARADLEAALDRRATAFAYPYGQPEHVGPRVRAAAEAAGYDFAVTTEPGANVPGVNRFALRRCAFHELVAGWRRASP